MQENKVPQLPILNQLTSLSVYFNMPLSKLYQLIERTTGAVHLTPGVGARFGTYFIVDNSSQPVPLNAQLLTYLTHFKVIVWEEKNEIVNSIFRCLPHMRHLVKVKLDISSLMKKLGCFDGYPTFLAALSSLTHLQEIDFDCSERCRTKQSLPRWARFQMTVLPSIRVLSLIYSTVEHTDVAEQFHLAHCFPELRKLHVQFEQSFCMHCLYYKTPEKSRSQLYQACGLVLAQGLMEIQLSKLLEKNIKFTFKSVDIEHGIISSFWDKLHFSLVGGWLACFQGLLNIYLNF